MGAGRVFPGLMAAGLLGSVGLVAVAGPAGAASATTVLNGTTSPAAVSTPTTGAVPAASPVDFEVSLAPRAGAAAFAQSVSTPGSAGYRHFLTAAQWEARFSPTAAQVGQVTSWLHQQGFTVGTVTADRMTVHASGSSAQVEQAFGTTLSYHVVGRHTLRLADRNLSIPSSLAGIVTGAPGVSQTYETPASTTGAQTAPAAVTGPVVDPAGGTGTASGGGPSPYPQPPGFRVATPCAKYYGEKTDSVQPPFGHGYPYPLPYAVCGYVPSQLRPAYGVANQVMGGMTGQGVTVAITDAYASPTLLADAQQYARTQDPKYPLASSQFSQVLPPSYDHGTECDASGWYGEQTLDVEAVHAMAPGAHIVYVGAQNCINGLYDAVGTVVDHHLADVITNSWSDTGGDLLDPPATKASFDNTLLMAAGTGISVMFSSGDNGDDFSTLGVTSPDYPASSPYTTAVGGTTLQIGSNGSRAGELGWSTGRSFLCTAPLFGSPGCSKQTANTWLPVSTDGGSGGGTSYSYPEPYYQTAVVPSSLTTVNSPIVGPAPKRVEPDISMEADPGTGFLVGETQVFPDGTYYDTYRIGGTSVASPLFAGMIALADQAAGTPLGFVNPAIYKLTSTNPSALYDVVPGGKQAQSRVDFANSINASEGLLYSTRIITYEGPEPYCNGNGNCATRNVTLSTAKGYDSMTGLGAPNKGFIPALAKS